MIGYKISKQKMHNYIFYSIEHEERCYIAFFKLSQQLSGNSMTEFWEIYVIINEITGTKKDSQRVQVVLATLLYRSPDSPGEHLP